MTVYELNLDGLVGPTHHYAGLAPGNTASTTNAYTMSNPAAAAHQGIAKMRLLHSLGVKQAVLPPHERPNLDLLNQLGFTGDPAVQVKTAKKIAPALLSACYSASSMWAANSATVSASCDSHDGRVHFTAANLISHLHRHQEGEFSRKLLMYLFNNNNYFHHHPTLPKTFMTSDEGAANHSRICQNHQSPGINLFVYGKRALTQNPSAPIPLKFPARHTLESSEAIARSHLLNPKHVIFAAQNPAAIDAGVFHNDVIAVANESVFLLHEDAWVNQNTILAELQQKADFKVQIITVLRKQISLAEAVNSYLFNSQLITLPGTQEMILIAPTECAMQNKINQVIDELIADPSNPITKVYYLDLKQSMRNGGGPACLRLRVPLNATELAAMHQPVLVTETLLDILDNWVTKHYRTELQSSDLDDPSLIDESYRALDELTQILQLGAIYPFQ